MNAEKSQFNEIADQPETDDLARCKVQKEVGCGWMWSEGVVRSLCALSLRAERIDA